MTDLELWGHQLRIWGPPRSDHYADAYLDMLEKYGPAAAHLAGHMSLWVVAAKIRRRQRS